MFIKLADDTKLGEITKSPADEFEVQKDLDRIEYQVLSNNVQFSGKNVKL